MGPWEWSDEEESMGWFLSLLEKMMKVSHCGEAETFRKYNFA